mgnify:FL=1
MMRIEEARATWTPPWTDMHARIEVALDYTWPLLNGDDPETASRLYSHRVAASRIVGELAAKDGVAVGLS